MNTTIKLDYKNETYILEYDKTSVKALENLGVDLMNILSKPVSNMDAMFQCAFLKNHPKISISKIDEILKSCKDKAGLLNALLQMVNEVMDIVTGEPDEEESKNVSWAVTTAKKPSVENSDSNKTNE
jgi:hypothetical protein